MNSLFKKITIVCIFIFFSACAGGTEQTTTPTEATVDYGALPMPKNPEYIVKILHGQIPNIDFPHHAASVFFKQYLESITGGRIGVEIYPLASLGTGTDVLPQLENGSLTVTFEALRIFAGFLPELQVLDIPLIIPPLQDPISANLFESDLVKIFNRKVKTKFPNITVEGLALYGFRQMALTEPINSYADLEGMKIRSTGAAIHEEFYKRLGAVPVTVPYNEIYTSLSTGIIDGIHAPLGDILGTQLEDFLKYIYLDNSLLHTTVWLVSDKAVNQLPEDLRKQTYIAIDMARQYYKWNVIATEYRNIGIMQAKGVTIQQTVSPEDIEIQKQVSEDIKEWFFDKYGEDAVEMYDKITALIKESQLAVEEVSLLNHTK